MYHYKSSGLDNIYLKNGYEETSYGDERCVSIHNIDGLHQAIAIALAEKPSALTAKEFKYLRVELDLSQRSLGKLMDKTDQSIAKWEKGEQPIPLLADKAIRDHYLNSIGKPLIGDLLQKLSELDRKVCEAEFELEEMESGWQSHQRDCA